LNVAYKLLKGDKAGYRDCFSSYLNSSFAGKKYCRNQNETVRKIEPQLLRMRLILQARERDNWTGN
jgi:hypothetical protein